MSGGFTPAIISVVILLLFVPLYFFVQVSSDRGDAEAAESVTNIKTEH